MANGFNLIGYPSSNIGLGAAGRNTLELLLSKKRAVSVMDIDAGNGRSSHETQFSRLCVSSGSQMVHPINLWHLNPPEVANIMHRNNFNLDWNRFNVCVPFWELPKLPAEWISILEQMDMILAPSRYIEGILATQLKSGKVRYYRQTLRLPKPEGWNRQELGIPRDHVIFVTGFDFSSDIIRKNPMAVLEIFIKNFSDNPKVHLVVKFNNKQMDGNSNQIGEAIKRSFKTVANVHILEGTMPHAKVLALYQDADAFVSLHRAEGLGLGPMESMFLGKPVIATGWSGNMDFMSETNSCPIGYKLVPVGKETMYGKIMRGEETFWADPDKEEASYWMRRLAFEPELRQKLGTRAASDIREFIRIAEEGRVWDELDTIFESGRDRHPLQQKVPAQFVPATV